jgi:hypothetical protein
MSYQISVYPPGLALFWHVFKYVAQLEPHGTFSSIQTVLTTGKDMICGLSHQIFRLRLHYKTNRLKIAKSVQNPYFQGFGLGPLVTEK